MKVGDGGVFRNAVPYDLRPIDVNRNCGLYVRVGTHEVLYDSNELLQDW